MASVFNPTNRLASTSLNGQGFLSYTYYGNKGRVPEQRDVATTTAGKTWRLGLTPDSRRWQKVLSNYSVSGTTPTLIGGFTFTLDNSGTAQSLTIEIDALSATGQKRNRVVFIGKNGRELSVSYDNPARYTFTGTEGYVRARIEGSGGMRAWTQPVFLK